MRRLCFSLSILILASLPAGCASNANAQSQESKLGANPTPASLTAKPTPSDTPKLELVAHDPLASCPITQPQEPAFTPPAPYSPYGPFTGWFWYGSDSLWTAIPDDAIWSGLPHNPEGYTQKVFWWRDGYVWTEEPEPALTVTGERLDATAPPLIVSKATNAYASDIGSAMLVGVDFPTAGCWKITGQYKKTLLTFVIWVEP